MSLRSWEGCLEEMLTIRKVIFNGINVKEISKFIETKIWRSDVLNENKNQEKIKEEEKHKFGIKVCQSTFLKTR